MPVAAELCVGWRADPTYAPCNVLHGESSKRLATPRNTKDKKHLQSTQSAQPTNLTDQAPSTTVQCVIVHMAWQCMAMHGCTCG